MGITVLVVVVLLIGISLGFMLGFACVMWVVARKNNRPQPRVVGPIFATLGGLGLVVALGSWIYTIHFTCIAVQTSGTVVEIRKQTDKDGDVTYAPTFRFQDAAGTVHTVSSSFFQSPPEFQVGDSVGVLYLPKNPDAARIDAYWEVWGIPSMAGLLGSGALSIGVVLITWPKIIERFRAKKVSVVAG